MRIRLTAFGSCGRIAREHLGALGATGWAWGTQELRSETDGRGPGGRCCWRPPGPRFPGRPSGRRRRWRCCWPRCWATPPAGDALLPACAVRLLACAAAAGADDGVEAVTATTPVPVRRRLAARLLLVLPVARWRRSSASPRWRGPTPAGAWSCSGARDRLRHRGRGRRATQPGRRAGHRRGRGGPERGTGPHAGAACAAAHRAAVGLDARTGRPGAPVSAGLIGWGTRDPATRSG